MPDEITVESLQSQMKKDAAEHAKTVNQLESLTSNLESFKEKHAAAEKHKKEQEKAAKAATEEAARKSGDIEALENSWKEKYTTLELSSNETVSGLNKVINSITLGAEAKSLAADLAMPGSAEVIQPIIEARLFVDMVDGMPQVKVSKDGKPSAMTLADLKTEISENKAFAPILKGSSANGAGNAGDGSGGGKVMKRSAFEQLAPAEKQAFFSEAGAKLTD